MRPDRVQPRLLVAGDDALDLGQEKGMRHADRQADVDFEAAMAWKHVDLDAALNDANRNGDLVQDRRGSRADPVVDRAKSGLDGLPDRAVLYHRQAFEFIEIPDQVGSDADRVRAGMGISGVGAGRVDLYHDAQRAFLAETH